MTLLDELDALKAENARLRKCLIRAREVVELVRRWSVENKHLGPDVMLKREAEALSDALKECRPF